MHKICKMVALFNDDVTYSRHLHNWTEKDLCLWISRIILTRGFTSPRRYIHDLPYIVTELSSYPRIHILLTNNELMNRSIS